jgi:hypothetical protein
MVRPVVMSGTASLPRKSKCAAFRQNVTSPQRRRKVIHRLNGKSMFLLDACHAMAVLPVDKSVAGLLTGQRSGYVERTGFAAVGADDLRTP